MGVPTDIAMHTQSKIRWTLPFLSALTLALVDRPAPASTPDGLPPSLETVCDVYSGAAFGTCNAYCEAMDCHLDEPNASARACERKRDKFIALTGETPPCELSCPCQVIEGFTDFVDGTLEGDMCVDLGEGQYEVSTDLGEGARASIFITATPTGDAICGYFDSFDGFTSLAIEGDDLDACTAIVDTIIERDELVCEEVLPPA